jgi:hypothetical protein
MASAWPVTNISQKELKRRYFRVPRMNSVRDEQQPGDVFVQNRSGLEDCAFQLCRENDPSEFHEVYN